MDSCRPVAMRRAPPGRRIGVEYVSAADTALGKRYEHGFQVAERPVLPWPDSRHLASTSPRHPPGAGYPRRPLGQSTAMTLAWTVPAAAITSRKPPQGRCSQPIRENLGAQPAPQTNPPHIRPRPQPRAFLTSSDPGAHGDARAVAVRSAGSNFQSLRILGGGGTRRAKEGTRRLGFPGKPHGLRSLSCVLPYRPSSATCTRARRFRRLLFGLALS